MTARGFDLAQTAGHRVYIEALRHLHCAMDNHRVLLTLLEKHGLTPWAPWNLLRPSFEAAFYALWVLEPDDGLTRRQRALKLELIDERERGLYYEVMGKMPGRDGAELRRAVAQRSADVGKVFRAEASQLGLDYAQTLRSSINLIDELGRLTLVQREPVEVRLFLQATWRSLSGYQHGHGYALMTGSDVTVLAPTPGGGQTVRTVVNDDNFTAAARAVVFLMAAAMNLWLRRSTRHN